MGQAIIGVILVLLWAKWLRDQYKQSLQQRQSYNWEDFGG